MGTGPRKWSRAVIHGVVWLLGSGLLAGCAGSAGQGGAPAGTPFRLSYLAKSDVDIVADLHIRSHFEHLRSLAVKLYKRNPDQLRKSGAATLKARLEQMFPVPPRWDHPELGGLRGSKAVLLAFDEAYSGDRVLAFVTGLAHMVYSAYGSQEEFFILDGLEPQKLYNCARNVEVAAWKLGTGRDPAGRLYLLSNSMSGKVMNLSFERLFGKLIGELDMMASIVAEQTNRTIRTVVHELATAVFLPI